MEIKNIVNLTTGTITIVDSNGNVIRTLPPSGNVIRCGTTTEHGGMIGNIPVMYTSYDEPVLVDKDGNEHPFPDRKEDTVYVVPSVEARAVAWLDFDDFYVPGGSVCDKDGKILGYRYLERV